MKILWVFRNIYRPFFSHKPVYTQTAAPCPDRRLRPEYGHKPGKVPPFNQRWRASDEIPAFVSIYLLPYERADIDGRLHGQRRLNTAAMEDVASCRTIMAEEGWDHMPLYVTEWNMTISQRNYFNDTCGKAALMADQMIRLLGQISLAAYDVISDFSGSYYDSSRLLIGAWGLITRAGIYKPSFYALTFVQMLGPYLLGTFENGIITAGERSEYIIFCYNHKQMKYNYYMRDEYDFDLPEVQHLFEDEKVLIFLLSWKVWKTESILSGSIMCPQFRAASLRSGNIWGLRNH